MQFVVGIGAILVAGVLVSAGAFSSSPAIRIQNTTEQEQAARSGQLQADRGVSEASTLHQDVYGGQVRGISSSTASPLVNTKSAHDIDTRSAKLRGYVDMRGVSGGIVFFVYGTDGRALTRVQSAYQTYDDITTEWDNNDLKKYRVATNLKDSESYERRVSGLHDDTEYFFQLCVQYENAQDRDVIDCGGVKRFETDDDRRFSGRLQEPRVRTDTATNVEADEAVISGEVDMNDFDLGLVFFVYGESEEMVREVDAVYDRYREIEEDGEDLERRRVDSELNMQREYEVRIDGLDDRTEIFYQICVDFDGGAKDLICGGTRSFTTDNNSNEDRPDVFTNAATRVVGDGTTLRGEVSMNDFINGKVFFVYGTDEDRIEDVPDRYDEYLDVRQSGDELQRVLVDEDLDGTDDFAYTVSDLLSETEYYYSLCVEFEDEDEDNFDRTEQRLKCGEVVNFDIE